MLKKIDIIVEVRTTSKRLPNKAILKVLDKTILELMLERLKRISNINDIIVATTINKNDDIIEEISIKNNVLVHRGSEDDVLGRVVETANRYKTDVIVEITGDNPLVDKNISEQVINYYLNNMDKFDYVSNDAFVYSDLFNHTCSSGFHTKVMPTKILKEVDELVSHPVDREHVVNYIFNGSKDYRIGQYTVNKKFNRSDIRLTLDYEEDFLLIKNIFENLYIDDPNFDANKIFDYLDKNEDIKNINSNCVQKKYHYK